MERWIGAVVVLGVGCAMPVGEELGPDERMTHSVSWVDRETVDAEYATCLAVHRAGRVRCTVSCGSSTHCYEICASTAHCGPSRARVDVFTPARVPDDAVGAACRAYFAHRASCGEVYDLDPCATFERTEQPSAVAVYDCLATLPCDADGSLCGLPALPTGLAERVSTLLRPEGYSLGPAAVAFLEHNDGWLRDDVSAIVSVCGAVVGEERAACVDAWLDAIDAW